jgi:hypothetical protein
MKHEGLRGLGCALPAAVAGVHLFSSSERRLKKCYFLTMAQKALFNTVMYFKPGILSQST